MGAYGTTAMHHWRSRTRSRRFANLGGRQRSIRVVIADNHRAMCEGLSAIFQTSARVAAVGIAGDRLGTLDAVGRTMPDIVLLDLDMPGGGLETALQLSVRFPAVKIIMLTACDDEMMMMHAYRLGAVGYLVKGLRARELLSAIGRVFAGESEIAPGVARKILAASNVRSTSADEEPFAVCLSPLERRILERIVAGDDGVATARQLDLPTHLAGHYVMNILHKLHARHRVRAVLDGSLSTRSVLRSLN